MKNNVTCTIRSEEIAIDVRICAALAANRGGEVYLAAIAPDMELTVITLDEAPGILPCFEEDDACLNLPNTCLLYTSYPHQQKNQRAQACRHDEPDGLHDKPNRKRCGQPVHSHSPHHQLGVGNAHLLLFQRRRQCLCRRHPEHPYGACLLYTSITEGIDSVYVNGVLVYKDKQFTGAAPGKMLRHNA